MANDALIKTQLANYYIEYALGRGGMAMVYYATDVKLERPAAVKVIDARLQGNPAYAKRFVDEAKIVASWRHPNIIQVYYADNQDDLYFFAMEYVEGATLEDLLQTYVEKAELMPYPDVIRIGRAVASALDYAHARGVIHRDVKPSNVMIGRDDRVILADFGLALDMAQGSMGEVFGTPHYIAPEQARHSAKAVAQSDLYSLGVMLYEMLTGVVPFDDESATSIAIQHISEPPPSPRSWNPDLNQATEMVLLKALSKEPENRYQSGKALLDALEEALLNRSVSETLMVDSSLPQMPPSVQRDKAPTPRKMSMLSISEMVELELSGRDKPAPTPPAQRSVLKPPTQESTLRRTKAAIQPQAKVEVPEVPQSATAIAAAPVPASNSNRGMLIGISGLVIGIIVMAGIAFALMRNTGGEIIPATSVAAALTADAMAQVVVTDEATLAPTDEPTVASTDVPPTLEPSLTWTPAPTLEPTFTWTPVPTLAPTATEPQVAASAVAFPNGNLLQLTYNSSTFYIRNASNENVRVSRLAFQAVDAAGNLLFYRFDGGDWARSYSLVERNGSCTGLEIADRPPWNRPGECDRMNSLITPSPTDERIFWAEGAVRDGAVAFAVFWDEVEIARCPINIGACDVRVGS